MISPCVCYATVNILLLVYYYTQIKLIENIKLHMTLCVCLCITYNHQEYPFQSGGGGQNTDGHISF